MTRLEKIGIFACIAVVLIGCFFAGLLYQRINACNEAGGLMIKTIEGWRCVKGLQ